MKWWKVYEKYTKNMSLMMGFTNLGKIHIFQETHSNTHFTCIFPRCLWQRQSGSTATSRSDCLNDDCFKGNNCLLDTQQVWLNVITTSYLPGTDHHLHRHIQQFLLPISYLQIWYCIWHKNWICAVQNTIYRNLNYFYIQRKCWVYIVYLTKMFCVAICLNE